jgi:AcrR family transcriptional regulator
MQSTLELFTSKGINNTSISDIVNKSGVAKGTFYLYFKDKYDIRNVLVAHESFKIFIHANTELERSQITQFEDKIIFLTNAVLDQLSNNKRLLTLISKNLSWGVFKQTLFEQQKKYDIDYKEIYRKMIQDSAYDYDKPELMLYMILELVNGSCYSSILYNDPVSLTELKPYLFRAIKNIIATHQID